MILFVECIILFTSFIVIISNFPGIIRTCLTTPRASVISYLKLSYKKKN